MTVLRMKPLWRYATGDLGRFGALLAAIGVALALLGLAQTLVAAHAVRSGDVASGVVDRMWIEHGPVSQHRAAYHYTDAAGHDHDKVEPVQAALFDRLSPGDVVDVIYRPADPQRSFLAGNIDTGLSRVLVTVGAIVALFGAAQLGARALRWRGLRRLALEGRLTEGRVVRVLATSMRIGRERQYRLEYGFDAADGRWRGGLSAHAPRRAIVRLEQGSPVHVLVDPADPRRHVLARDLLEVG